MKLIIIILWCVFLLFRLKITHQVLLLCILIIPSLFYVISKDKANTFRITLLSLTLIPFIPLPFTSIFLFLPTVLNDEYLRKTARWKLIVFTGIDGSGKTTHSKETVKYLRTKGIDCVAYHWFKHILVSSISVAYAKLLKKPVIKHRYVKGEHVYTNEFRKKVRTSLSILRPLIQFIDNWVFIGTTLLVNMVKGRWVICDRYFYDYYIRFKVLGYPVPKILEWLIYRLTPNPHLLIVFDVNPLISYKRRKGEHPLWYYVYARREYLKIAKIKKTMIINTEESFNKVQQLINKIIDKTLNTK